MNERAARPALTTAGIALIVVTFAYLLFWRTGPYEALTNDFRPLMNPGTVAQLNADIDGLEAAAAEYDSALIPALAQRLGVSRAELETTLAKQYPATTTGMKAIPAAGPGLRRLAGAFGKQQALFEKSDAIPTAGFTTTGIPWALTGAGILALIVAASAARRRASAVVAVAVGFALTVVPLLILMPSKAAAADRLNANLAPIMTRAAADQLDQTVVALKSMTTEITTTMLPAVAAQLQVPPAQASTFLAQNFPALAAALGNAPASLARAETLAGVFKANVPRYQTIDSVSFRVVTWTSIVAGLVMMLAGLAAYGSAAQVSAFRTQRRREATARKSAAA